jgi:hypothetical protein
MAGGGRVLRPDLSTELYRSSAWASTVLEVLGRWWWASTHSEGDEIHRLCAGSWAGGARLDGARVAEL